MKWVASLKAFRTNGKKLFKVTRRLPDLSVAETKVFNAQEEALQQFIEWSAE